MGKKAIKSNPTGDMMSRSLVVVGVDELQPGDLVHEVLSRHVTGTANLGAERHFTRVNGIVKRVDIKEVSNDRERWTVTLTNDATVVGYFTRCLGVTGVMITRR
jgi:hypothetical protein